MQLKIIFNKGIKVVKKPSFCRFIPGLSYTAQAISPYIFVSAEVFDDITSENPNPRFIAAWNTKRNILKDKKN